MHGVINRSIECFVTTTYGKPVWQDVVSGAAIGFDHFEGMLIYEDHVTEAVLQEACKATNQDRFAFLEDLGTFLVSDSSFETVRRLLRFGGMTFVEFLSSLDDLRGRAMLALPDLEMPELR